MDQTDRQGGKRRLQAVAAMLLLLSCSASQQPDEGGVREAGERPFVLSPVASFSSPWAMSFLPGSGVRLTGAALVSEREGRLWLVNARTGGKQLVSGVPRAAVGGQGGLGDVVAHPDFASNRRVYLTFAEAGERGRRGAALGYGTLERDKGSYRLAGFRVIWRQVPKVTGDGHFSHRIAFAPDGTLFLSSGDRQKMAPAQSYAASLGKILHLSADGQAAPGNPWASRGGVAAQFWTMGHRNILGLAFAADGRLWATEMGPQGGDELNLVERGRNYGWPRVSNGSHYGGGDIPDHSPRAPFAPPKLWWKSSISPAGLIIYSGDLFPQWRGDALFGALSGMALVRADLDGAAARKGDHWPLDERIREVEQGPDGEVYLLEDGGRLVRLMPAG